MNETEDKTEAYTEAKKWAEEHEFLTEPFYWVKTTSASCESTAFVRFDEAEKVLRSLLGGVKTQKERADFGFPPFVVGVRIDRSNEPGYMKIVIEHKFVGKDGAGRDTLLTMPLYRFRPPSGWSEPTDIERHFLKSINSTSDEK